MMGARYSVNKGVILVDFGIVYFANKGDSSCVHFARCIPVNAFIPVFSLSYCGTIRRSP